MCDAHFKQSPFICTCMIYNRLLLETSVSLHVSLVRTHGSSIRGHWGVWQPTRAAKRFKYYHKSCISFCRLVSTGRNAVHISYQTPQRQMTASRLKFRPNGLWYCRMCVSGATPSIYITVLAPRFPNKSTSTNKNNLKITVVYLVAAHDENPVPTLFSFTLSDWGVYPAPCSLYWYINEQKTVTDGEKGSPVRLGFAAQPEEMASFRFSSCQHGCRAKTDRAATRSTFYQPLPCYWIMAFSNNCLIFFWHRPT